MSSYDDDNFDFLADDDVIIKENLKKTGLVVVNIPTDNSDPNKISSLYEKPIKQKHKKHNIQIHTEEYAPDDLVVSDGKKSTDVSDVDNEEYISDSESINSESNNIQLNNYANLSQFNINPVEKQRRIESLAHIKTFLGTFFDIDDNTQLDENILEKTLNDLEYIWNLNPKYTHITKLMLYCENMDFIWSDNLMPKDIEDIYDKAQHIVYTNMLYLRFQSAGLVHDESPRNKEFLSRFERLYDIQYYALQLIYSEVRLKFLASSEHTMVVPNCLGLLKFTSRFTTKEVKELPKLILFFLNTLSQRQYRRKGEYIYEKKNVKYKGNTYFTNAWEQKMSISDFCYQAIHIEHNFEMFQSIGSIKTAINILTYYKSPYFKDLVVNPFYVSFANGVYFIGNDIFYPYNKNECITSREKGEVAYKSYQDILTEDDKWYLPLDTEIVTFNYIPIVFRHKYYVKDPMKIVTPMDKILSAQEIPSNVQRFIWGFLGRGLYSLGARSKLLDVKDEIENEKGEKITIEKQRTIPENWQINLNLIGYGGTGKSTLLRHYFYLFPLDDIGIISNNIEYQWALSSLIGSDKKFKRIIIGPDLKKNFAMDQGIVQNAISAEEVSVAIKNQTAFATKFTAPIFFGMNEFFSRWKDSSDSLRRRMIFVYFDHFIPKDKKNLAMHQEIKENIDLILQKENLCYIDLVEKYAEKDIWSVLPEYFFETSDHCISAMDPLLRFLSNTEVVVRDDELCMTFDMLKEAYKFWYSKEVSTQLPKMNWTKEFYGAIFDNLRIKIDTQVISKDGRQSYTQILKGIDLSDNFKEEMKNDLKYSKIFQKQIPPSLISKKNVEESPKRKINDDKMNSPNKHIKI